MIDTISKSLTNRLLSTKLIEESQYDQVHYGMQYLISLVISIIILMVIAVVTGGYVEVLGFIIGFVLLRSSVGGFHAGSFLLCQILSVVVIVLNILILQYGDITLAIVGLITVLNILTIFILAPIQHKNRPFTAEEFDKFKIMGRVKVLLISFITIAGVLLFDWLNVFLISVIAGVFTSTLSIFIAYARSERGTCNDNHV